MFALPIVPLETEVWKYHRQTAIRQRNMVGLGLLNLKDSSMKRMRAVTALWASIPLMISGCQKQPQQTSSAPTTAQKATTPVFVFSKTVSPSEVAPKGNENLGKPRDPVYRLDLPQAEAHAVVQGDARTILEAALSGANRSALLSDYSASALIDNLPKGFRDSCDQMLAGWGNTLEGTAKWSVRLLFSLPHQSRGTEAVLALRWRANW